ncbi:MAG: hypothetical protein IT450_19530 [Phycisphaerales bacterium]|nr:hypothetical protein [Phycisphaerales bacterium]
MLPKTGRRTTGEPDIFTRLISISVVGAFLATLAGCQLIAAPFLMWGPEPTKDVPAEYPYLPGKKVAIVVWADTDTLFEFPQVQFEVAEYVTAAMKGNVKGASFVPNRQVVDYQRRDSAWERRSPNDIGRDLGADRVLMLELTEYTTREPGSPHLKRGRVAANLKIYDSDHKDSAPTYKANIACKYPTGDAADWGGDDRSVRAAAMQLFADEVAGKFYDRKVKVK